LDKINVLGRVACLGQWVLAMKKNVNVLANQPKLRVDLLLDYANNPAKKPQINTIHNLIDRKDIIGILEHQQNMPWFSINEKPDVIVMDSYSELTDQKFTHKNGWSFSAHYTDIAKHPDLTCEGLLDVNNMFKTYQSFFQHVKNKYNVPVVFIHFPTTFDERELYIKQGQAIKDSFSVLEKMYDIINIHADIGQIKKRHPHDEVYHFHDDMVKHLVDKIKII